MTAKSEFLIATKGLTVSLLNTLDLLLGSAGGNKFGLTTSKDESICIFQTQSTDDVDILSKYQQEFPDRPVILLRDRVANIELNENDRLVFLTLPLTPKGLIDALNKAVEHCGQSGVGKNPKAVAKPSKPSKAVKPEIAIDIDGEKFISSRQDVNLDDPEESKEIRYSIELFIVARLAAAYQLGQKDNSNVQVYTPHGVFSYYPREHKVHVELNLHSLRNLASVPEVCTSPMTAFDSDEIPETPGHKQLVCADTLLWNTALWSSRGRLPFETDIDQPFSLKQWPNFTRWLVTPFAMQISALWLDNRMSLRQTVDLMDIPQRYVFCLYSSALVCGLIDFQEVNQKSPETIDTRERRSGMKNLLGKILDYVKFDGSEEI